MPMQRAKRLQISRIAIDQCMLHMYSITAPLAWAHHGSGGGGTARATTKSECCGCDKASFDACSF